MFFILLSLLLHKGTVYATAQPEEKSSALKSSTISNGVSAAEGRIRSAGTSVAVVYHLPGRADQASCSSRSPLPLPSLTLLVPSFASLTGGARYRTGIGRAVTEKGARPGTVEEMRSPCRLRYRSIAQLVCKCQPPNLPCHSHRPF